MSDESGSEAFLARARDAVSRGEWQQAYDLLVETDAQSPLSAPDLALLADMAYGAGHLDVTIAAWERAYGQSVRAGDRLAAAGAAVRVAMHLLFDTALMAPVRGWTKRVEQLLEGLDETPVHAWLAVVRNYERLLSGDFPAARQWARRAIDTGTKCSPAAAAIGRVAEARSLILEGSVAQGLGLLNEAAVAAVSGELDPISTGIVYCEVVCGLQALAQYDLAEEWTEAMERWRQVQPVGSVHGRCRVRGAEILGLRGSWGEAEKEALVACEELRPYLRREFGWPLTELGRIRLRRGDVPGAEAAFLAAHEVGWDPQPGLALVRLARGDVALAAASIRDALERPGNVPSKEVPPNTELRRAPLLEAQVEIEVAAGNLDSARPARSGTSERAGPVNVFRREGDFWSVVFEDRTTRLRDLKGLQYLARLLADPGKEFHVLELVSAERAESPMLLGGDAGELLDAPAKQAYRRRLAEIEEDLEEARTLANSDRAAQAEAEREFLVRELARAVGLAGRDRRAASVSERARASVTKAVREAMARIREHNAPLGEHLERAIRTGTYCAYLPDARLPVNWHL